MMQSSDSPTPDCPTDWYKRSFGRSYLNLYARRDRGEAERQVDFLLSIERLAGHPVTRALDVGCGAGRHSWALSRRIAQPVGVDLSPELLAEAVSEQPRHGSARSPDFIRADMRALPFAKASFDLLLSMFTSFGYFDSDHAHEQLLQEWHRVLQPGGTLVLDYLNRDYLLASLVPESVDVQAGKRIVQHRSITDDGSRVEKRISVTDVASGEIEEFVESVRAYSAAQLNALLQQIGFELRQAYGSWNGELFSPQTERFIIFAKAQ